jgi:8-oxo-dGTP pyrophosphatase MutT (NUDIX family)
VGFEGSLLWRIRQKVGTDLVLWPGATVLVERADGRVLLGLRSDNGNWCMPGGGAEEGQSFATCALAELWEELGLEADEDDLLAFGSISRPEDHLVTYPGGDRSHYFGLWFVLRRWRGEVVCDGEEMVRAEWFARDALPSPLQHATALGFELYERWLTTERFQAR